MKDELKKEYSLRITQANKSQMVVILYEMFMTYVEDATKDLQDAKIKAYRVDIQRARAVLKELMGSLNLEVEPAPTILKLYIYISKLLVNADLHSDEKPLAEACKIMKKLHDAYAQIQDQDTSGPVMGNTQTVYAGMTYSKNNLSISIDGNSNRGFLV